MSGGYLAKAPAAPVIGADDPLLNELVQRLQDENDMLRDRIKELEASANLMPIEFQLTSKEESVLNLLAARSKCSRQQIMSHLYTVGVDDEPEIKIVDVFICKLRKKIKPLGVVIDTLWGHGYSLPAASKQIIRDMQNR